MTPPPYRFGPLIEPDGVRFRLWAPSGSEILVEVAGLAPVRLQETSEGWKEAKLPCAVGARYRFRIGDTCFPDPASRLQEGGVHGWSVVCACSHRSPTLWPGRPWNEAVIYEVHAGIAGGFGGLAKRCAQLADLGITAIELMPIAAFPGARNWGYDGVLPFAPANSYGSPADLLALVRHAHSLKFMVFLDVVYNHFGPDGNYLPRYAKQFFRDDASTPWGAGIDFRQKWVRRFFTENALYWIREFGIDGLRFDAVHAMRDDGWLAELAEEIRQDATDRKIHLILENDDNEAKYLRNGFDAQWNDDIHHVLHVLLTGESIGYYADFAKAPAEKLARALIQGFVFQGENSGSHGGRPHGTASADLGPTSFVAFLQNHDQTGNRALGDRLTTLTKRDALEAAVALLLLCPQIPLIFMGEEIGSRSPFLYFTDHNAELAAAVREGRAREFATLHTEAQSLRIPDPNTQDTFAASSPCADAPDAEFWKRYYRTLLCIRSERIVPHIFGAHGIDAKVVGEKAVVARWRLSNGELLTIASNLGNQAAIARLPAGIPIWHTSAAEPLGPYSTFAWLE